MQMRCGVTERVKSVRTDHRASDKKLQMPARTESRSMASLTWAVLLYNMHACTPRRSYTHVLRAPAETINGAHGALLGICDGNNAAVMKLVKKSPSVLTAPAETINCAHSALLGICDGDNEAVMALVRRDSVVLRTRAPTLLRNFQALAARLGREARALEHLDQHSLRASGAFYRNPVCNGLSNAVPRGAANNCPIPCSFAASPIPAAGHGPAPAR